MNIKGTMQQWKKNKYHDAYLYHRVMVMLGTRVVFGRFVHNMIRIMVRYDIDDH